jgi:hypothetical protein
MARTHSAITLPLVTALLVAVVAAFPAHADVLGPHHPRITYETTRLGDWRLDIARDPFSGGIACRLRSGDHKAFYRADAVGFRFAAKWNVAQAVYRLDGGEPRTQRDDLPELIASGTPLDRGGMDNASGGVVWVPFETLRQANMIAIAPRPDRRAVTLHFRGLIALHDIAVERGCSPESSFVE